MSITTSRRGSTRRLVLAGVAAAVALGVTVLPGADPAQSDTDVVTALDPAKCGPGSRPEPGIAGRAPAEDFASGRAQQGYTCNTALVSQTGGSGGLKVERFRDEQGHTCAFYDLELMLPLGVLTAGFKGIGTAVLDMTDPANPRRTATLLTPAMLAPHESLLVHQDRGLLVAVMGTFLTAPGVLDVYDVKEDCRRPKLLSSSPAGFLGHESGFSPDGRTFYASSMVGMTITAVDLDDPTRPTPLAVIPGTLSHGVRTSPDGNTLYIADLGRPDQDKLTNGGLKIMDVSEIQARMPNPRAHLLSTYTWPDLAIPQVPEPMEINGHRYVLMVDEFTDLPWARTAQYRPDAPPALARIINVDDPRNPFQVSALRLQVHLTENRAGAQQNDPMAKNPIGGYSAHYCAIPRYRNPKLAACAYIASGLRIFDLTDPYRPREAAYFNRPTATGGYAMAKPAFDRPRKSVWFSDVTGGFFAVRLTNGVWPGGL